MVSDTEERNFNMTTREKILASARKEFSDKGLDGSRVDRIAEASGVNKAMIYYHFSSKEGLYRAVLEELLGQLGAFLERASGEAGDLDEFLVQTSSFMTTLFESTGDLAPIVLREMAGGGERIRDLFEKVILEAGAPERLRGLLSASIQEGDARPLDPQQTFVSFIGMNLFYLLFSPIINSIWEIEDEAAFRRSRPDAVVDLFLNGIRKR
jgi:AcrR family transcriptional regulator